MIDRVAATLEHHGMLRFGRRIGVAVSGGADSVFLLHALSRLGLATCIFHINHQLRGEESQKDEAFVRDLAFGHGIPIFVLSRPIGEGNTEQEARRARYDYFRELIEAQYCDAVATGHNQDDQAETVLFRFARGSGTAGLSGIRPVTESRIIRPLIELRRGDIRDWLRFAELLWREDGTNQDTGFVRNRIRLKVMPELEAQLNPSIVKTLASTAEWARDEENYWQVELNRLEPEYLRRRGPAVLIGIEPFSGLPAAVQRRLLRRAIEHISGDLLSIGFDHVEGIRRMMATREGSGRVQLPGLDIYRSFDWLRLAPPGIESGANRDFSVSLPVPGITSLPERGITLKIELVKADGVYNKQQMNALDWDRCAGALELRNWRPGDRIHRENAATSEKIKTLFQEFRVPLWERRNWPVIVRGESILWTRRFGPDRDAAARPSSQTLMIVQDVSARETEESNDGLGASIEQNALAGPGVGVSEAATGHGEF